MKNQPLVIDKSVKFSSVAIRSFWDVNGDESYSNHWPRDRKLPYRDGTLVVVYTEKGSGIIELINGECIYILGNCLVLLNPKDIVHYRCNNLIWKLYWIEIYAPTQIGILTPLKKVINIYNSRHFDIQISELLSLFKKNDQVSHLYSAALFNKIFYEWLLTANSSNLSKSQELVFSVIEEMHHQLSDNWQVKSMAKFANCSEQYLRKLFVSHIGKSPKEYYLQLKLDIALGVLTKGSKTISQTAYDLGFSDAFHFSNAFKRQFGYCPSSVEPTENIAAQLIRSEINE